MAEAITTNGSALQGEHVVGNETILEADTAMTEGTATITTETDLPETTVPELPRPPMRAPESFTREDLAMENNPAVTAEAPSRTSAATSTFTTTIEPPNEYAGINEGQPEPVLLPETSATGWLVPPALSTPTSKITFDGTRLTFVSVYLINPQMYYVQFEIETFLQLKSVFRHLMLWDSDYLALSEITFEWGDSYDDKDWMRLGAILAPTLMVDYTEVNGHKWDSMPASDFVGIMSHIGFVGDPLVHTQHHIGASKWQKISEEEVIGHHQLRAAHQRYTSADLKTVENKGHGHAMVMHFYRKIEGVWKLAGLRPTVRWNEFEFEKIFKGF